MGKTREIRTLTALYFLAVALLFLSALLPVAGYAAVMFGTAGAVLAVHVTRRHPAPTV